MTMYHLFSDYCDLTAQDVLTLDNEEMEHPIVVDIQNGGKIVDCEVLYDWEDDSLPCYTIRIRTEVNNYVVAFWWVSGDTLIDLGRAEGNKKKSLKFINSCLS